MAEKGAPKKAGIHLGWHMSFAGTSACAATMFVQPMDLTKNRMQTNRGLTV